MFSQTKQHSEIKKLKIMKCMHACRNERLTCTNGWMNKLMNEWMNECMTGAINDCMNEGMKWWMN